MKIINLGNAEVKIMGSPITAYYYKKEFNQSLSGDLFALKDVANDESKLDDINILQMIWALAKTVDRGIKPFVNWLEDIESVNLLDVINDVAEETYNACFREKQVREK